VVDALSKRAHEMHMEANNMYISYLKDKIIEATISNQQYLQIKETLQQGNLQQIFKNYKLQEDRILMYKGKIYVPISILPYGI